MIAVSIGRAKARAWPVSSIISTSDEIGPCVVAASIAPAPSSANRPISPPGMNPEPETRRALRRSSAPAASEGVNRPPGAPLAAEATVASGRSSKSAARASGASGCRNRSWARSWPLPSSSGKTIDRSPTPTKTTRRRDEPPPVGRTDAIGPCDRPDEHDRPQADERRGDDRPEVDLGRNGVDRNCVERRVGHDEARRLGCDQRGGERGHDQPQRQRPAQHFERKQRAAERHAIDGGHAGPGADRDHQAALLVRELLQARKQIAEDRAELFRAAFAAERGAHADDDDRQHRAAERSERRQAAGLKPDRRGDLDAVAAGQPRQQPLARGR